MSKAPWIASASGVTIHCRLTPKGGRDALESVIELADGQPVLTARVRAAPEDGKANEALRQLIAAHLGTSVSKVTLTAGTKSRVKQLAVEGDSVALMARLREHLA